MSRSFSYFLLPINIFLAQPGWQIRKHGPLETGILQKVLALVSLSETLNEVLMDLLLRLLL